MVLGDLATNCYLLGGENDEVVVVDPADDGVGLAQLINDRKLWCKEIWLTHGHFDHCLGAMDLRMIFEAEIAMSNKDKFLIDRAAGTAEYFLGNFVESPNIDRIDIDLDKRGTLDFGGKNWQVISCPGHTPGSVAFYSPLLGVVLAGDTIFAEGVGRTDYGYGDKRDLLSSIDKLLKLPSETIVLPGHGEPTTIGEFRGWWNQSREGGWQ